MFMHSISRYKIVVNLTDGNTRFYLYNFQIFLNCGHIFLLLINISALKRTENGTFFGAGSW